MTEIATRHQELRTVILEQFRCASVTDRNGSRVGCFTQFAVPDGCPLFSTEVKSPLDGPTIRMRDIANAYGRDPMQPDFGTAGSLLFHDGGKIVMLECYAEGESWPHDHYDFEILPAEGDEAGR